MAAVANQTTTKIACEIQVDCMLQFSGPKQMQSNVKFDFELKRGRERERRTPSGG